MLVVVPLHIILTPAHSVIVAVKAPWVVRLVFQGIELRFTRGVVVYGLGGGLYRYRHLVENLFARLKHYRAVASRYDKLKRNYESVVALACAYLWLPM